jgi:hypothetical protein
VPEDGKPAVGGGGRVGVLPDQFADACTPCFDVQRTDLVDEDVAETGDVLRPAMRCLRV